jgi:hypothetical protein
MRTLPPRNRSASSRQKQFVRAELNVNTCAFSAFARTVKAITAYAREHDANTLGSHRSCELVPDGRI